MMHKRRLRDIGKCKKGKSRHRIDFLHLLGSLWLECSMLGLLYLWRVYVCAWKCVMVCAQTRNISRKYRKGRK